MQSVEGLARRFEPGGQVDHLLGHDVEPGGCVDHQIAQLLEGLTLGFEFAVGAGRRDHHLGQQLPLLQRCLRSIVIEGLAHGECLSQRFFRILQGRAERLGAFGAELLDGQLQLGLTGTDSVVDVDHDRAGQLIERLQRHRRQRVRICRIHPFGGLELGVAALGPAPARPPPHQPGQHRDHAEADQHARPGDPAGCGGRGRIGVQAVGGGDRRAGPVVAAQGRSDAVAPDVVGTVFAPHRRGHLERERPIHRGDREKCVVVTEIAQPHGVPGPVVLALAGEILGEDHPQLDVAIVVQPVDGALHIGALGGRQHAGVVGELGGQPRRRLGRGARGNQQADGQDREQHGQQTGDTHDRQSSALHGRRVGSWQTVRR